jgi:hypothetical protein
MPQEALWSTPQAPASIVNAATLRLKDPDYQWLSDNGTFQSPYVRYGTGRGRFLLRVTYLPSFQFASAKSETAGTKDLYDSNSGMVHIESIGRPGEFDPNDPTFFTQDPTTGANGVGPFRKVEAFVPVGLLDQLWWVTNVTNERGPATIGVPPYVDGLANTVEYPAEYDGTIRSNMDLRFDGRSVIRVYPARGEGVFVKGQIFLGSSESNGSPPPDQPPVRIDVMADTGGQDIEPGTSVPAALPARQVPEDFQDENPANDSRITWRPLLGSQDPNFDPIAMYNYGDAATASSLRYVVQDEGHWRSDALLGNRSVRLQSAPDMDQVDAGTGVSHWLKLTRDSGATVQVTDTNGGNARIVNSGWYGLTDQILPADLRARGLYIDNFDDIQHPKNRPAVRDEWLHRNPQDQSWRSGTYTPTVLNNPGEHPNRIARGPVTDLFFKTDTNGKPVVVVTRVDPDVRQLNIPPMAASNLRAQYLPKKNGANYQLIPSGTDAQGNSFDSAGNPVPGDGRVRVYDIPENGVIFAEGSISVHGVYGTSNPAHRPRPLTIASGGCVYINGNLLQYRNGNHPYATGSGWQIALLAHDDVVLNPTGLVGADSSGWAQVTPHGQFTPPAGDHDYYDLAAGQSDLEFKTSAAFDPTFNPATNLALYLKHSGQYEDNLSTTHVSLQMQVGNNFGNYDFDANLPPNPPGYWQPSSNPAHPTEYLFHFLSSPGPTYVWSESNFQSPPPAVNFEQKLFDMNGLSVPAGQDLTFRLTPGLNTYPNEQNYFLSRIALLPKNAPLPMRVEAVVYAFHGSWFVIPPPYFNENQNDSRAQYLANNNTRPQGVIPPDTDVIPFYHEPLNVEIQVVGSISENVPAEPSERAAWTKQMWTSPGTYDPTEFPAQVVPAYRPNLRYRYDGDLRRMVRVRFTRPYTVTVTDSVTNKSVDILRDEEVAWVAPGPPRAGVRTLATIMGEAAANNSFVQTLPLVPHLPASTVLYEGNPL